MNNKVAILKAEIAEIIKNFKQNLELKIDEMSERHSKILRNSIEKRERLVNVIDETGIEYFDDELNSIRSVFGGFCSMYNTDYTPKETTINNLMYSTFIVTPEWIKLKGSVLNPHNTDNKCFQYSITLSLYHEQIGKNFY